MRKLADIERERAQQHAGDDEPLALPQGAKNYITPAGYARLKRELQSLLDKERPELVKVIAWAASNGDRSENADYIYGKRRLREIDRRLRFLRKRMEIAEVIDPSRQKNHEQIYFGATVTYLTGHGEEKTVKIVGIDEARSELHEISWISPVAKALLKAAEGDTVEVRTPKGIERIEILKILY